jgi:hypothetical protein
MKKKLLFLFILTLVTTITATGAMARTIIDIGPSYPNDPSQPTVPGYTAVETWRSGQIPGNNYNGTSNFYDVIGNRFATDKMTISAAGVGPTVIQIWTNNQPGGWNVAGKNFGVADIAVDTWRPNLANYDAYTQQHFPGAQSRFDYGINMQAYAAGTPGQAGGGNAFLAMVTVWETSFANVNPLGGLVYGGAYKADVAPAGSEQAPVEVRMVDYTTQFVGNMNWVVNDPTLNFNNNVPDYLITVTFAPGPGGEYDYLWGTARCANDVVYSATPIPGTLVLLGSSLLGMLGVGLRKKKLV